MNVSSVVGQSREVVSASIPWTPSIVSSNRACSSVLKSGWFSNGSSCMYFPRGISCSSAALRRFSSRWSWITCENIDDVSTAMKSSCSDAITLRRGSVVDLGCNRLRRDDDPVLSLALGRVESGVGRGEDLPQLVALRKRGDPETGVHCAEVAVRHLHVVLFDRCPGALGKAGSTGGVRAGKHKRKLFSAPAAGNVALARRLAQRGGERLQYLVACSVTV